MVTLRDVSAKRGHVVVGEHAGLKGRFKIVVGVHREVCRP